MAALAPSEERTAHHVQRLHASIRDLQNALGVYAKANRPSRPLRSAVTVDTPATDDPRSRIVANNDRGVVQHIERLEAIGAVVLGLEGIGALVAETLCRYGVQRLIIGDPTERALGDLDFMTCYVQDVGVSRERHVAAIARRLDPEIHVFALGLPLSNTSLLVESLRTMLVPPNHLQDEDDRESVDSSADDGNSDDSDDEKTHPKRPRRRRETSDELCFSVVFLCGVYPELAMPLNELCCEFGIQLVHVAMGREGFTGDAVSVVPGRSACLQCLEKRKMLKLSGAANTVSDITSVYNVGLPTTECVLAGIAVQHAFAHLLGAGPVCSRIEYDGYREEFGRSGFVAPVHQCPSHYCREQQHRHQQHRAPPTASSTSPRY